MRTDTAHRVTVAFEPQHNIHQGYSFLPGDLVSQAEDGTWGKFAPGLAIRGFTLTDEQVASLEVVTVEIYSPLHYRVVPS
jgi:hypothetical protein